MISIVLLGVILGGFSASTPREVDIMLDIAQVKSTDVVYDLGSGDGRIVIEAARRGAYSVGIEIRDDLVKLSRENIKNAKLESRAVILHRDIFDTLLFPASVITLFFGPADIKKLDSKLKTLSRGVRVVSNGVPIDNWTPIVVIDIGRKICDTLTDIKDKVCKNSPIYLYRVE